MLGNQHNVSCLFDPEMPIRGFTGSYVLELFFVEQEPPELPPWVWQSTSYCKTQSAGLKDILLFVKKKLHHVTSPKNTNEENWIEELLAASSLYAKLG